jgi:hypothetical protein
VPAVALGAEPAPVPAAPAAPLLPQAPAAPAPPSERLEMQPSGPNSREPARSTPSQHLGDTAVDQGNDPFYQGAPPAAIQWLDDAATARLERAGDTRGGAWAVAGRAARAPALRPQADRRQCITVSHDERLLLRWHSRVGHGSPLDQGQRYRLLLPRISVVGPVPLELIAIVGSSDAYGRPALVAHVMSTPAPSTVGLLFDPTHSDPAAPVSLFVDAAGASGSSTLCLGAAQLDLHPEARASDGSPSPAPKGRAKQPNRARPAPQRENCNPPFYTDDLGVERLKPKCL